MVAKPLLANADCLRRILFCHLADRDWRIVARMSGLSELRHALGNNLLHGFASRLQVVARIELLRRLSEYLPDRARDRQAVVGIDVDLAHAVADAELNLFDRHT